MKYATTSAPLGLITAIMLLLSACGGGSESVVESEPTAVPAATATEVPAPTATPVPPTPEPTATTIPTAIPEPTSTPVPPTPEPTEEPTAEPVEEEAAGEATDDAATEEPAAEEPAAEEPAAEEPAAAEPAVADGAAIFSSSCATCHGAGGAGSDRGPSIIGIGQFFTSDASPLVGLVTNGGTNMPSFGAELTTGEIDAVVQYVVATFQ